MIRRNSSPTPTPLYSPKKLKSFTRQFVHLRPDTFVVFDRVVATRAEFPKTWVMHTMDEPDLSEQGDRFTAEYGEGRLDVWTLLPKGAGLSLVGGSGKLYMVDGRNYLPDKKGDPECGRWRVEVKPAKPAATHLFLHVLHATEHGFAHTPRLKLLKADGVFVVVEIALGGRTTTLTFHAQGKPGGRIKITAGGKSVVDEASTIVTSC